MCLEQDVWIVKGVRNIKNLFRDFIRAGELTPSYVKQPQPSQGRRQVNRAFKFSRQMFRALESNANLRCGPAMNTHQCGTELR